MVIAAFICFVLLIIGWFIAPSSSREMAPAAAVQPTDLAVSVAP